MFSHWGIRQAEGVRAHGGIQVATQEEMLEGCQILRSPIPEQGMAELRLKGPLRDSAQSHKASRERVLLKSLSLTGQRMGTWDNFKQICGLFLNTVFV